MRFSVPRAAPWLIVGSALQLSILSCDGAPPADQLLEDIALGGAGSSPNDSGGSSAGGASTGGRSPEGSGDGGQAGATNTECSTDADCDAENECQRPYCGASVCLNAPLPRGKPCSTGVCNGSLDMADCVPCIDDTASPWTDTGCSTELPHCNDDDSRPECLGCETDSDCYDGIQCTRNSCVDSVCQSTILPLGLSCDGGICNGEGGDDSCVPCVDDAEAGLDAGCTKPELSCDASQSPPVCVGCLSTADCNDQNDCTVETCQNGSCEYSTVLVGSPCDSGYCNGVPGLEACLVTECLVDSECNDGINCTTDVCGASICAYTTDDSQCPDSGDLCRPYHCAVGSGCQQTDISNSVELLSDGNFDEVSANWIPTSTNYEEVVTGDGYLSRVQAHTPDFVAFLGGGMPLLEEYNSLHQVVRVPAGAVTLELSFYYQIQSDDLPDDHNQMQVRLIATEAGQSDLDIVTFHNQDRLFVWAEYRETIDATAWAGSDVLLEFSGTGINSYTGFFVDTVSLVARVCDGP